MGLFDVLFSRDKRDKRKQDLAQWIVDHNTRAYLGIGPMSSHSVDFYYFDWTVEELEAKKARMEVTHQKYEYDKAHPEPKIGNTYTVYIFGRPVDTLRNVTNVSYNDRGVFFTITSKEGQVSLKEYFGGNINWTKG